MIKLDETVYKPIQAKIESLLKSICKRNSENYQVWYLEEYSENKEQEASACWCIKICDSSQYHRSSKLTEKEIDKITKNIESWVKEAKKQLRKIGATNIVSTNKRLSRIYYLTFDLEKIGAPIKRKRKVKNTNEQVQQPDSSI